MMNSSGWRVPALDEHGVHTAAEPLDSISFSENALDVLHVHAAQSWWNERRVSWATDTMTAWGIDQLLEVGAGNGAMSIALHRSGIDVVAIEPHLEGCRRIADAGVPVMHGTLASISLPEGSVPAIGYFDVIEHLPDPSIELAAAARVLRPGGHLLVTVPAYQWLWSSEDTRAGHFRRYQRSSLRAEMAAAGLVEERTTHLFPLLVAPAFLARRVPHLLGRRDEPAADAQRLARQLEPPRVVRRMLEVVSAVERAVGRHYTIPFGLTVAGHFRKPAVGD